MDKKTTKPILLASILQVFLNNHLEKSDKGFEIKLWQNWSLFNIANITTKPVSYKAGKLVLWVENNVEIQELYFHTAELKQKINSHFKKKWITDIHFTVNSSLVKQKEQTAKLLKKINL